MQSTVTEAVCRATADVDSVVYQTLGRVDADRSVFGLRASQLQKSVEKHLFEKQARELSELQLTVERLRADAAIQSEKQATASNEEGRLVRWREYIRKLL